MPGPPSLAQRNRQSAYGSSIRRPTHSENEFRDAVAVIEAQLAELKAQHKMPTVRQFSARHSELVAAWTEADLTQRGRLVTKKERLTYVWRRHTTRWLRRVCPMYRPNPTCRSPMGKLCPTPARAGVKQAKAHQ
jgi:hypothetical protein